MHSSVAGNMPVKRLPSFNFERYIYRRDGRSSSSSPLRAAAATSAFADRAESIFVVEPSKSAKTQTAFSGHVQLVLTHAAAEEQSRCI
jgi:hypothetical protein